MLTPTAQPRTTATAAEKWQLSAPMHATEPRDRVAPAGWPVQRRFGCERGERTRGEGGKEGAVERVAGN